MKKVIILIIIICANQDIIAQTKNGSSQVYTLKFKKVSPLEYKHHRFEYNYESERVAVKSLNISKVTSPEYKNHFDEIHKAKNRAVNVLSEPTKLKGPNYKNRRFRE